MNSRDDKTQAEGTDIPRTYISRGHAQTRSDNHLVRIGISNATEGVHVPLREHHVIKFGKIHL